MSATPSKYAGHVETDLPSEIWLVGQVCAGKDAIADALVEHKAYMKYGVSEALSAEVASEQGVTYQHVRANKGQYRDRLQEIGSKRRQHDPWYWPKKIAATYDGPFSMFCCVQPSCRFVNEAHFAMERGAFVCKVVCPELARQNRITRLYGELTEEQRNHPAEAEIERVPYHAILYGTWPSAGTIIHHVAAAYQAWKEANRPTIHP